jgi:hypothetical protein
MGATMLIKLWERLRGYDKWTATEATIVSSELVDPFEPQHREGRFGVARAIVGSWPFLSWRSNCAITWTDASGASHAARYAAAENNRRLFQKYEGQKVEIRYNPAHPDEYYLRELFQQQLLFATQRAFLLFYLALFLAVMAHSLFRTFEHFHRH